MKQVYEFTKYDIMSDKQLVPKRRGTREAIQRLGGVPIEGSATTVDESALDPEGFVVESD